MVSYLVIEPCVYISHRALLCGDCMCVATAWGTFMLVLVFMLLFLNSLFKPVLEERERGDEAAKEMEGRGSMLMRAKDKRPPWFP